MDLTNQQVIFKNGSIHTVNAHDDYLHINVDGEEKLYDYNYSFRNKCITAFSPNIQSQIINELEEDDILKKSLENDAKNWRIFQKNLKSYINKIQPLLKYKKYENAHLEDLVAIYNNYFNKTS